MSNTPLIQQSEAIKAWLFTENADGTLSPASFSSFAPLNSPAFTGVPTAPTPATSDNSNTLATTAYVQNQGYPTTITTNVTAAQLKSLQTAPITIIPAPGPGKMIVPLSILFTYKPNTTAFVVNNANWELNYDFSAFIPLFGGAAQGSVALTAGQNPTNMGFAGLTPISVGVNPTAFGTNLSQLFQNVAIKLYNIGNTSSAWQSYITVGQPVLTIALPGSGFAVNDVFTLAGNNTGTSRFTVNSVNAAGGILTFTQVTAAANANTNAQFYSRSYVKVTAATGVGVNAYVNIAVGAMGGSGISASTLGNSGGTGYNPGDTGTISANSGSGINATYTVLTTSSGAVATYSITFTGQGFFVANNLATSHTTGAGTGFTINVTGVGAGFAAGDTGTMSGGTYTINTVDGNGNVLTFTLAGTQSSTQGSPVLGVKGGAQPGIGTGFYLFPTSLSNDVTTGDGSLDVTMIYVIVTP